LLAQKFVFREDARTILFDAVEQSTRADAAANPDEIEARMALLFEV